MESGLDNYMGPSNGKFQELEKIFQVLAFFAQLLGKLLLSSCPTSWLPRWTFCHMHWPPCPRRSTLQLFKLKPYLIFQRTRHSWGSLDHLSVCACAPIHISISTSIHTYRWRGKGTSLSLSSTVSTRSSWKYILVTSTAIWPIPHGT